MCFQKKKTGKIYIIKPQVRKQRAPVQRCVWRGSCSSLQEVGNTWSRSACQGRAALQAEGHVRVKIHLSAKLEVCM